MVAFNSYVIDYQIQKKLLYIYIYQNDIIIPIPDPFYYDYPIIYHNRSLKEGFSKVSHHPKGIKGISLEAQDPIMTDGSPDDVRLFACHRMKNLALVCMNSDDLLHKHIYIYTYTQKLHNHN